MRTEPRLLVSVLLPDMTSAVGILVGGWRANILQELLFSATASGFAAYSGRKGGIL